MIYLTIYLCINCFLAGLCANDVDETGWRKAGWLMLHILFAVPAVLFYAIRDLFVGMISFLQLGFWFKWWFTKKFYNLPPDQLQWIERKCGWFNTSSIRDRIYRHCARKIFKANNYTPNQQNENLAPTS